MSIGYVVIFLGTMASFFKINSEVVGEEVEYYLSEGSTPQPLADFVKPTKSGKTVYPCPSCGAALRYVRKYERWYCDNEKKYV